MAVHSSRWKDAHLVIGPPIEQAQLAHNRRFQKGLYVEDCRSGRQTLVAVVNTARYDLRRINPSSLRVKKGERLPTSYLSAALSTRSDGNALGCFIITAASKDRLRSQFGADSGKAARLLNGASEQLIAAVKAEAEKDPKIKYLTALSTPVNIEKGLHPEPGCPASVEQVIQYLMHHRCTVLHDFHGRLGAELLKVIARPDGHAGRPLSGKLGGGGVIALMVYPFREGRGLIERRPHGLVSVRSPT